ARRALPGRTTIAGGEGRARSRPLVASRLRDGAVQARPGECAAERTGSGGTDRGRAPARRRRDPAAHRTRAFIQGRAVTLPLRSSGLQAPGSRLRAPGSGLRAPAPGSGPGPWALVQVAILSLSALHGPFVVRRRRVDN